jgi:glycosyltransferase involved in cell wall biosynthesis
LRRANLVTVGSVALQQSAAARVPAGRLRVWPLGVDLDRFTPERPPGEPALLAGRPAILHVGSLSPVKDQATLVEAFARARGSLPDAHLHLVGDGDERRALGARVEALGLVSRVTFHGAIPHDRLPPYYRASDVCVLSSRFESQSMVVLEAAACGRRTIGTRVGVLPDVGGADAAVTPGDPQALADLLVSSVGGGRERPLRPLITRDQLASGYGVATSVSRLCEIYRSITA